MASAILKIKDEVNVKFEGLDVSTRRKISDKLKYFVPYAYHLPSYKLGRWDGKVGFFGLGVTGLLGGYPAQYQFSQTPAASPLQTALGLGRGLAGIFGALK